MFENRQGTGKGVAWVKSNFKSNRVNVVIEQAEKFLDNMNLQVIGKGWSADVEREEGGIVVNENLAYQRREWNSSLYYIYLEYKMLFNRSFFSQP